MQVMVDIGSGTHAGCMRANNEDAFLVARATRTLEILQSNLKAAEIPYWAAERAYGFLVADGMGGHAAGEVASHLALKTIVEHVLATADWIMRDATRLGARIEKRLAERFSAADMAVLEQANATPLLSGMGTTLTVALSLGSQGFVGHVGDSRAYLLREGQLQRLTRDHSLVQTLVDSGTISREEAAAHHMRNVLLRSLGGGAVKADVQSLRLASGDQLLLCTDGLTEMVDEEEIGQILQESQGAQAACDELIAAALDAGGTDNVTVIVVRYSWNSSGQRARE